MMIKEDKFKNYKKACKAKVSFVIVDNIGVLGDDIGELEKNISLALKHDKKIIVVNGDYKIQKF